MAKFEGLLRGDFEEIRRECMTLILKSSVSAHLEDETRISLEGSRLHFMVFERYSLIGENRLSLSIVMAEKPQGVFMSAISSGGSQGIFYKVNRFGEEAFLDKLRPLIKKYS